MTAVEVSRDAIPHDLEVERQLLGAMLLGSEPISAATAVCTGTDFHSPNHAGIFEAIVSLHGRGEPVDPVLVRDEMRRSGGPEVALADLITLHSEAPTRGAARRLAEIVAEMSRRRAGIALAAELRQGATTGDLAETLTRHIDAVDVLRRGTSPPERTLTLREFLGEDIGEPEWLVRDLIERGDRVIVTGLEGGGKSTLLRQMALLPAAGIHPFSLEPIPPVRVLLVDAENPQGIVQRKLNELRALLPDDTSADDHLYIEMVSGQIDLLDSQSVARFEAIVDDVAPELLVIGPTYKLAGGDPNEDSHAGAIQTPIDRLRARHGCAVLLEAHTPHGSEERPFGSSRWKRWPEFGIFLSPEGSLRHWRGQRDQRDWPRALVRGGPWPWTAVEADRDETPYGDGRSRCADAVMDLFTSEPDEEYSLNEVHKQLRALGKSYRKETIAVAAETLVNMGQLARRNGPRNSLQFRLRTPEHDRFPLVPTGSGEVGTTTGSDRFPPAPYGAVDGTSAGNQSVIDLGAARSRRDGPNTDAG